MGKFCLVEEYHQGGPATNWATPSSISTISCSGHSSTVSAGFTQCLAVCRVDFIPSANVLSQNHGYLTICADSCGLLVDHPGVGLRRIHNSPIMAGRPVCSKQPVGSL